MEVWLVLLTACILLLAKAIHPTSINNSTSCTARTTPLGRQVLCHNLTAIQYDLPTSIEWFICYQCHLQLVDKVNITTTNTKFITHLNLSDDQIRHIKPFAFTKLLRLKVLLMKKNYIKAIETKTFHNLHNLLQLDVSDNALQLINENNFVELENLDVLNLNHNDISELHPRAFAGLHNLKYLYLNTNLIAFLHPYIFKDLKQLKILYLENNLIKELQPLSFTNLNRLELLYMNNNSMDLLIEYNFKELSSLVDLQLRANQLRELPASAFNGLRHLKFLYLGDNRLTTLHQHAFTGLDSLLVLDLINNTLDSFAVDYMADMPQLHTVWLENNAISNLNISMDTKNHSRLSTLDLFNNSLSYFNYKMLLSKFEALDELIVGGNRWRCEFIVPMLDYCDERNVSVCVTSKCALNVMNYYEEKLCRVSLNASVQNSAIVHRCYNNNKSNLLFICFVFILAYNTVSINASN